MTPEILSAWADAIKNGLLGIVVMALAIGGQRRWYVFGWQYNDLVRDRDEWKAMALRGAHVAERAATVAETFVLPGPVGG